MNELAELQGAFQDYLISGGGAIHRRVLGTAQVPAEIRLGIYAGAYASRLAEALGANFPAMLRLMGEEDFNALARAYVAAHASTFFSIRHYGDRLAAFLASDPAYGEAPVLAELARWEWCVGLTFDAADATPLTHEVLAQVHPQQWAQLRLRWHPSVQRLDLHWNAPQIWQAVTEESEVPPVAFSQQAQPWLLWRQGLTTYFRSLPGTEAAVLDAGRQGGSFGELCTLLCAEVGDAAAPLQAATLLRSWVAAGLITDAD
ncbi:MAG: putative DNA-binding domain-containing protein [Proteobacteria bacterium]|nr:putative DNA-binding domain-containing protein [Pseudomonadota bacterium]